VRRDYDAVRIVLSLHVVRQHERLQLEMNRVPGTLIMWVYA